MLGLRSEERPDRASGKKPPADSKMITVLEENISKRPRKLHRPWLRNKEPWKEDVSLTKKTKPQLPKRFENPPEPQLAVSEFSVQPELFDPPLEDPYPPPFKRVDPGVRQPGPDPDSSLDKLANQNSVSQLPGLADLPSPASESSHEKAISKFIQMKSAKQTLAHPRKPDGPAVKKNRIAPGTRPEHVSQASLVRRVVKNSAKKKKPDEE